MSFFVFERDPFVRADICEMLTAHFPDCAICSVTTLDEFAESAARAVRPVIAILSTNWADLNAPLQALTSHSKDCSIVVINDDNNRIAHSSIKLRHVPRPFSSSMLIKAVRSVICGPQTDPSQTL